MCMSNARWMPEVSKFMSLVKNPSMTYSAHGILVPSMSTVEDARAVVSYAKFPSVTKLQTGPKLLGSPSTFPTVSGIRGVGSPFAPAAFQQTFVDYVRTANQNTFIAVQIETLQGLENCEEIAKVDGIGTYLYGKCLIQVKISKQLKDMLFIGYALSVVVRCTNSSIN